MVEESGFQEREPPFSKTLVSLLWFVVSVYIALIMTSGFALAPCKDEETLAQAIKKHSKSKYDKQGLINKLAGHSLDEDLFGGDKLNHFVREQVLETLDLHQFGTIFDGPEVPREVKLSTWAQRIMSLAHNNVGTMRQMEPHARKCVTKKYHLITAVIVKEFKKLKNILPTMMSGDLNSKSLHEIVTEYRVFQNSTSVKF